MPDTVDYPQPSVEETGVLSFVPLLTIQPYQIDNPKTMINESDRASQDKAALFGYFAAEQQAYEVVMPELHIPVHVTNQLSDTMDKQIKTENPLDMSEYMTQRNAYFQQLRASEKYSEAVMNTLESYERCMRRMTVIGLMKPEEFALYYNAKQIPIPQVLSRVQNAFQPKEDKSGTHEEPLVQAKKNKQQLIEAIKQQIRLAYKAGK